MNPLPSPSFPLLWRTLRPLKLSQLLWRLRYRWERTSPNFESVQYAPKTPPILRNDPITLFPFEQPLEIYWLTEIEKGNWHFLNKVKNLGMPPNDLLGNLPQDRLWAVHFFSHKWLFQLAMALKTRPETIGSIKKCIQGWIENYPMEKPGARDLAWNSYVTATRIGNWVRTYYELGPAFWEKDPALNSLFLKQLWTHASYLHSHLEWDLRGNHLLRDATGLAWAGWFFAGPEADQWRKTAATLALNQAKEQILPDGGHFERSPYYHIHVMEDLLTLSHLLPKTEDCETLKITLKRMADFLTWMRHPDGLIALFNDGSYQGAMDPNKMLEILGFEQKRPEGGKLHHDFGLAVWQGDPWTLFFDIGEVGPDVQPGHAHADTLSIECSYRGQRLFVDPGTFSYDLDDRRKYDRSTHSHNTLSIDGLDSSEVWHIFRVGRRAHPRNIKFQTDKDVFKVEAWHDGYLHLSGNPFHRRSITVEKNGIFIEDKVEGGGVHTLSGGFLLSPEWEPSLGSGGWKLKNQGRSLQMKVHGPPDLKLSVHRSMYHPSYGIEQETYRLCWDWKGILPFALKFHLE